MLHRSSRCLNRGFLELHGGLIDRFLWAATALGLPFMTRDVTHSVNWDDITGIVSPEAQARCSPCPIYYDPTISCVATGLGFHAQAMREMKRVGIGKGETRVEKGKGGKKAQRKGRTEGRKEIR